MSLTPYASSSARRRRQQQKSRIQFALMSGHGYSTTRNLQLAWHVNAATARATVARLIRDGGLRRHRSPATGRDLLFYTAAGIAEARSEHETGCVYATPTRIGHTRVLHSLAVQQTVTVVARNLYGARLDQLDLRFEMSFQSRHIQIQPDAALRRRGASDWTLIEVERTQKSAARLDDKLFSLAAVLTNPEASPARALYIGPDAVIARINQHIQRAASQGGPLADVGMDGRLQAFSRARMHRQLTELADEDEWAL